MADPVQPSNPAMAVAASALQAQQSRMRIIAENIANADFDLADRRAATPIAGRCRCSRPRASPAAPRASP